MLKKTFKWLDTAAAFILVLVLGSLLLAYGWVSWKPRDITQHVPQILDELDLDLAEAGYKLDFESAVIRNEGFEAPLLLSVKALSLKTPDDKVLLDIPELKVAPSFWALLKGKIFPSSVDIVGADFAILQDEEGIFYLDTKEQAAPTRLDSVFFPEEDESTSAEGDEFNFEELFELGLNRINISKAAIQFKSEKTGFLLELPSVSARIDSVLLSQQVMGSFSASYFNARKKPSLLQSVFHYDHEKKILKNDLNVHQLTLSQYAGLSEELSELGQVVLPLSGKVTSEITLPNKIETLQFDLNSKETANLHIKGAVTGSLEKPVLEVQGSLGKFDLPFLKANWPMGVGKDAFRWISESIKQATVSKAEFEARITPETLQQEVLPKEAVKAVLHIEDAVIDYTTGFPLAKKAKGRVIFEGQGLRAEIDAVQMLKTTQLHKTEKHPIALVKIPDLMLDNINILLDIPLRASVEDVLKFMTSTPYKLPSSMALASEEIEGNLQGVLSMQIVDQISPIEDDVDFQLDAQLQNIAYIGLTSGADLSEFKGALQADNNGVALNADGKFNGQAFDLLVKAREGNQEYGYKGYLPVSVISLFAKDFPPYLAGAVSLDAQWKEEKGSKPFISLDADTRNMSYSLSALNIQKQIGQAGRIEAKGSLTDGRISLPSVQVSDTNINFSGSLGIGRNSGKVLNAKIAHLALGKTRLSGDYFLKAGKHHLTLKGKMLDVEPLSKGKTKSDKSALQYLTEIPDVSLDVSLDKVRFGDDRELQEARVLAECLNGRCEQFELSAHNGETPFSAKIGSVDGKRSFTAQTPDLGRILRVTGLFNDMRKGKLQINAVYQDELPNRPMAGRATLEDFNVRDIPILAKLLTVATFTGILDSLSGGGLHFQKMVMPFQYDTQKLVIKDAKAAGPSVGITANGSLNVKPNTLKLEGALIPAKLLDTLLVNIPILGEVYEALTGGEGLLAMNYSIEGNVDDPKVGVNPLSVLTPGFLRGFFDIFTPSSKDEAEAAEAAEEALETVEKDIEAMEEEAEKSEKAAEPVKEETKEFSPKSENNQSERRQGDSFLRRKR